MSLFKGIANMNERHSTAIIVLLSAIFCVLLFGATAFLSGMTWVLGIGAAIVSIAFVLLLLKKILKFTLEGIFDVRANGQPWIWLIFVFPAIVCNFLVFAIAFAECYTGCNKFGATLLAVPFYWVPQALFATGFLVLAIETAHTWWPKIPTLFFAAMRNWILLSCAPLLGPFGRWRSIRASRAEGKKISSLSALLSVGGTFFVSILLWLPGVGIPLLLVSAIIKAGLRYLQSS
jgi:hypothetical protein